MLTVSVRDQGTPARRDYARLTVHVSDENDHGPQFLSDLVVGQVPETAAEGSQVVTVLATDRDHGDNARIAYSIQSGESGVIAATWSPTPYSRVRWELQVWCLIGQW